MQVRGEWTYTVAGRWRPPKGTTYLHRSMLTLLAGPPLALRTPQPVRTRRDALIAASGLASASVLPAYAGLPFDPIGAYGKIGPGPMGPPPRINGQPNSGLLLLREVFDGALPEEGLLAWYELIKK